MKVTNTLLSCFAKFTIVVLSFLVLSPFFSPFLNSDNAIHILMGYDFQLPSDYYFWGQDRLGSIIPLLTHVLYKLLHVSPALLSSLVLYGIVLIFVLLLSRFIEKRWYKVLLCVLLFFPAHTTDHMLRLAHPYASQYVFILLSLTFLYLFQKAVKERLDIKAGVLLMGVFLSGIIAFWSSEGSVIAILSLIGAAAIQLRKDQSMIEAVRKFPRMKLGLFLLIGVFMITMGACFIGYAKSNSMRVASYNSHWMASSSEMEQGVRYYLTAFYHGLCGNEGILISLHNIFFLALILFSILLLIQKRKTAFGFIPLFLLFNTLGGEMMVIMSKWVCLNHYNFWYQTYPYISLIALFVILGDRCNAPRMKQLFAGLLICYALITVSSTATVYLTQKDKDPNERSLKDLKPLAQLGHCGIIGDQWNSFLLASRNPELLKVTSWYGDRNKRCIDSVVACKTIYLVKNGWLDAFPKQKSIFGRDLQFTNDSVIISGFELGKYQSVNPLP